MLDVMAAHPQRTDQRPRVTLYARVSSDRRKHDRQRSVTQQLTIGRRIAIGNVWNIVGEYADNDRSASGYATQEREDWPKVEADIEAGRTDILWAIEISRGTRDLLVWAKLAKVCKEKGVLIALDDDVWDPRKPSHMRHLNQLMVDAVYESDKTATRVGRDTAANAERGGVHGPWGYGFRHEYDPDTGELLRRVVHEPEAAVIREVAARFLSGETLGTISADLNSRRIPTSAGLVAGEPILDEHGAPALNEVTGDPKVQRGWQHQLWVQILQRAALIGRREHRGRIVEAGGWDPIFNGTVVNGVRLDEAAWREIRERLGVRPRDRGEAHAVRDGSAQHLLSGIALCGVCGARMYRTIDKKAPDGWVYQCRGLYQGAPKGHVSRSGVRLEEAVTAQIIARLSLPDAVDAFRERGPEPEEVERAHARKSELRAELKELERDVAAGEVSPRMATARERQIEEEMTSLDEVTRPRLVDPIVKALTSGAPAVTWGEWTLEQKRSALRALTERIEVPKLGRGRRQVPPEEYVRVVWAGE